MISPFVSQLSFNILRLHIARSHEITITALRSWAGPGDKTGVVYTCLVPRRSLAPVFNHLQLVKTGARGGLGTRLLCTDYQLKV